MKLLANVRARMLVKRELDRIERQLRAELRRELDARLLEHKATVAAELARLEQRIDGALARSLRALNPPTGGRAS